MICEILGTADGINKKKSIDTRRFSVKDKKIIDPSKVIIVSQAHYKKI